MNTYTNFNEMKTIVEDKIKAAGENIEEYDIYEITNELCEYDVDENTFTFFTEDFDNAEDFWKIAEQYELHKDFSEVSNRNLLDQFEDAVNEEDEFTAEQLRKEIFKRMN